MESKPQHLAVIFKSKGAADSMEVSKEQVLMTRSENKMDRKDAKRYAVDNEAKSYTLGRLLDNSILEAVSRFGKQESCVDSKDNGRRACFYLHGMTATNDHVFLIICCSR